MQHHIVLYRKPGCHLCELVEQLLLGLRGEYDLLVKVVDISRDPQLLGLYGTAIPVLEIDHRWTLTAPIRVGDVRAALDRFNG